VQLSEVLEFVRRIGRSRCVLRRSFRLLFGFRFVFLSAAVMSDCGSRRSSNQQTTAPRPASHSHASTIDPSALAVTRRIRLPSHKAWFLTDNADL